MSLNLNNDKIKEISDQVSALPTENQRLLFIMSFLLSKDVYYRANVGRNGKTGDVELLVKKDHPMTEKEMGVACLESSAALLVEAGKKLGVSLDELTVYLHLIIEEMKEK